MSNFLKMGHMPNIPRMEFSAHHKEPDVDIMARVFGIDLAKRNPPTFLGGIITREPGTEEILKDLGGINMNGKKFVEPKDVEKVIIRTKDGSEFEGSVERSEYMPGPYGSAGYSFLTVKTVAPERAGKYGIKRVIFNNPATIVFWDDGTRTVVYCQDNIKKTKRTVNGKAVEVMKPQKSKTYSEEIGLAMAIVKKHYGNGGNYNNNFRNFIPGMKERDKAEKKAARKAKKEGGRGE